MAEDQHYVPKFYLKGFTEDKRLWVFERDQKFRESKPKNEAHRPDFYCFDDSGQRDDSPEKALEQIESRAAPIVRKLANIEYDLTPENVADIVLFVAFMFVRTPVWREHLNRLAVRMRRDHDLALAGDKERFYKQCAEVDALKSMTEVQYEELRQLLLRDDLDLQQKSVGFNLSMMFKSGFEISNWLSEYAPPEIKFVTSDCPVFTLGPDVDGDPALGMGFGWKDVAVYFPLNKRACLVLKRGIRPTAIKTNRDRTESINRLSMMNATKYVYASQGLQRTRRLFDQDGCKVKIGENAFMADPPPPGWKPR
jgi:hypothetical protein